jgi:hypothetical protein
MPKIDLDTSECAYFRDALRTAIAHAKDPEIRAGFEKLERRTWDHKSWEDQSDHLNGNRPLPFARDDLGRMVREAWVRWAQSQSNPKPSWLTPYDELSEPDKEADRQIGEAIARWTLIGDAARVANLSK